LPTPKLSDDHHGTRCAGQVAAGKNNACGIGLAYESKVAGVRILSGPISDVDEAASLNYGFQNVSIYSCSWGPPDNGALIARLQLKISRDFQVKAWKAPDILSKRLLSTASITAGAV
jgi:hypothetical protein